MNYAQQRWMQLFRYTTTGLQAIVVLGFLLITLQPSLPGPEIIATTLQSLGLIHVSIAVLHIIFALLLYKPIVLKNELGGPAILGALIVSNALVLVHASGGLLTPWIVLWALVVALSGILGFVAATIPPLLITLYFLLLQVNSLNGSNGNSAIGTQLFEVGIVVATYLLAIASWLFWRRYYINNENAELKRVSGQLKNRQQVSDILIESITDGIIVTDTDGKITIMNTAASHMTEWEVHETISIDIRSVVHVQTEGDSTNPPQQKDIFSNTLSQQSTIEETLQLVGRNGKKIIASLAISPIMNNQDTFNGVVAVIRDVSEAHAEEQRRADFISTASHEMRTPVAAIEGYLALALNEKVSKLDSNARTYINKAYASTKHLGKLFQDLLTSAKAEDGRLVSHPQAIELGEFLQQLVDDLRFSAEKKGLLVERVIGTASKQQQTNANQVKPLYYASVDPDRLREVITNLFDNAVKYTESGKITVGLTGNNEVIQLFIKDTGAGIPKEDISHLFQKFYRVDNSSTRTVGGTGLGLFICRKIIELYNGRIWVESDSGKGSTFYIDLPRMNSQEAMTMQKQQSSNE